MTETDLFEKLLNGKAAFATLLIAALWCLIKKWVVPGWVVSDMQKQLDAANARADKWEQRAWELQGSTAKAVSMTKDAITVAVKEAPK